MPDMENLPDAPEPTAEDAAAEFIRSFQENLKYILTKGKSPETRALELVVQQYNQIAVDHYYISVSNGGSRVRAQRDLGAKAISYEDLRLVWFSKTLQNWKALVCTVRDDQMYFEVTYNGDKKEAYVDIYDKLKNVVVPDEDSNA